MPIDERKKAISDAAKSVAAATSVYLLAKAPLEQKMQMANSILMGTGLAILILGSAEGLAFSEGELDSAEVGLGEIAGLAENLLNDP